MASLNTANDGDADLITLFTDGATPVFQSGKELYIWAGETFTPGAVLNINGHLEIGVGATLNSVANAVNIGGNFINSGTFTHTAGTDLTFNGTIAQTFNPGSLALGSDVFITNTTAAVSLTGNALNISTNDLTITGTNAILSLNGQNLTTDVLSNTGTLRLRGSETVTLTTQDTDSGTWEYVGDADGLADTFTLIDFGGGVDYYNLKISTTDSTDIIQKNTSDLNTSG